MKHCAAWNDTWLFQLHVLVGGSSLQADVWFQEKFDSPGLLDAHYRPNARFLFRPGEKSCAVWLSKPFPHLIAHESLHVTGHVLRECGMGPMTGKSEEAYAYLLEWVVREINKGLKGKMRPIG